MVVVQPQDLRRLRFQINARILNDTRLDEGVCKAGCGRVAFSHKPGMEEWRGVCPTCGADTIRGLRRVEAF